MFPLFVPLFHFVRNQSSWARTYSVLARKLEHAARTESILIPTKQLTSRSFPFTLIDQELTHICLQLISRLGSAHPGLANLSQNYFLDPRNQLRSSATLLFAKATNGLGEGWQEKQRLAAYQASSGLDEELDRPLHHPGLLYGSNPCMADDPSSFADVFRLRRPGVDPLMRPLPPSLESSISSDVDMPPSILPTQVRLAQIVEMIYLASLLCDHVTDTSPESAIDNKLAVLGSDFLLGRAGTALSSLGECEVVELVVTIISNQVEGEINRMQSSKLGCVQEQGPSSLDEGWDLYLKTIYLRIASLMGKSVRGAVILGGSRETELYKDVAYAYGRNLGMAHQVCPYQNRGRHLLTRAIAC